MTTWLDMQKDCYAQQAQTYIFHEAPFNGYSDTDFICFHTKMAIFSNLRKAIRSPV